MTVHGALVSAASDFYRPSWRLAILNALLGLMVAAVALAVLAARSALVLAVLLGPFAAALMYCAVRVAETEELRLAEAVTGLRRYWRRGLALAALLVGVALLGAEAIPFYAGLGVWGWPLAALSAYLVIAFAVLQLALWPLAVLEEQRRFRDVLREAGQTVLRRPLGFAVLALTLLIVNAIGLAAAILPFLTLTIAFSFLASAHFSLPKNSAREA